MPSFQSPVPISGRPWRADGEAAVEGAGAVLVERAAFSAATAGAK